MYIGWLVGWMVGRSVGQLVGRLVDGLVGRLVGWWDGWSVFLSVGRSIFLSVGWSLWSSSINPRSSVVILGQPVASVVVIIIFHYLRQMIEIKFFSPVATGRPCLEK